MQPPPWEEFTTSEPSFRATRVRPPGTRRTSRPDSTNGRRSMCRGATPASDHVPPVFDGERLVVYALADTGMGAAPIVVLEPRPAAAAVQRPVSGAAPERARRGPNSLTHPPVSRQICRPTRE